MRNHIIIKPICEDPYYDLVQITTKKAIYLDQSVAVIINHELPIHTPLFLGYQSYNLIGSCKHFIQQNDGYIALGLGTASSTLMLNSVASKHDYSAVVDLLMDEFHEFNPTLPKRIAPLVWGELTLDSYHAYMSWQISDYKIFHAPALNLIALQNGKVTVITNARDCNQNIYQTILNLKDSAHAA